VLLCLLIQSLCCNITVNDDDDDHVDDDYDDDDDVKQQKHEYDRRLNDLGFKHVYTVDDVGLDDDDSL